ncbi:hypothetical protein HZH68_015408 [Vespula germanica]|uniref:Uncharacterized protein n=1 Tax=Vespula germanica TaxID=30212 RepID=A0A834MSX8_VESGE|nr:hypothetical protein HZH68_015408 [Vespula germanica]
MPVPCATVHIASGSLLWLRCNHASLLPAVTINCKSRNNLLPKNQNNDTDTKMMSQNSQVPEKNKNVQKLEHLGKGRTLKASMKSINAAVGNKDSILNSITTTTDVAVTVTRMSSSIKKSNDNKDDLQSNDQALIKSSSIVVTNQTSTTFASMRRMNSCAGKVSHESTGTVQDYSVKKYSKEMDPKLNNYQVQQDNNEKSVTHQDYKNRSSNTMTNLPIRFSNQTSIQALQRENHMHSNVHSRPVSRNDNAAFSAVRKALEQQNSAVTMAPINFPPLRAPQSIVNVRHPSVTEARIKHEMSTSNMKSKLNVPSSLHERGMKDLEQSEQIFHNYDTSQIASVPNVQNISNVTANISTYHTPDSYPQPTVANVLFPETAQFPQSSPFSTTQIGQLNQYQTYDPGSFASTSVNVNPVIPQFSAEFSAENSMPYPQYENPPQFVQPNHYPAADIASNQYQYQPAAVGQIQDSPVYIQNMQSPINVADQYAPTYARAVRTELMPRLRRPPRFNK